MATTPTYPGVYIQELPSAVHPITGVATSIGAFVGYTARGIDNRAEQIFSFADYERLFGGLASDSELSYAVQQFFTNGGTQAYVVRVPRSGAKGAQVVFNSLTFTALSSGIWADGKLLLDVDYNGVDRVTDPTALNLTVTSLVDGTVESFPNLSLKNSFNNYIANVVNDPDNGSKLVSVQVGSPAPAAAPAVTGLVGKSLVIAAVNNSLAGSPLVTGTVKLVAGSATVAGSGGGFSTAALQPGQWLVFGSDTTQTLYQIATIKNGTTLILTTPYRGAPANTSTVNISNTAANNDYGVQLFVTSPATQPQPLPISIKVFSNTTQLPQTVSGLAAQLQKAINAALAVQMPGASVQASVFLSGTDQAIRVNALIPQNPDAVLTVIAPTAASGLADASKPLGLSTGAANVGHYALGTGNGTATGWNGQQTSSPLGSDGSGLPGNNELIGDPAAFSGIYALEKVDLFNLLSIPDATRATPGNPSALDPAVDPNAIYGAAIALCDSKRAMLLVDCPPYVNAVTPAVDWITSGLTVSNENGAAFFPRLRVPDPLNNYQLRTFAPSGTVAGLYARIDSTRGVWKAPAGTEATLAGVQSLVYKLSDAENGVLNPLGLNCSRTFPVYGTVLWGARTLLGADADQSQWKYVPVRRVALFIEESLYRGTQWVVFEPNDEPLWSAIRLNVGSFMQNLFRNGFFQGSTPNEAYFVKCDSETTTQTDIDNGVVNIIVGFAPLQPAEFVVIKIQQMAGQTSS
jgi:phage tail sheath protein FI